MKKKITNLDPGFYSVAPGRTMSKSYAFQTVVQDVKESIRHQDSHEGQQILTEALQILEEHLQETFYKAG